jgi:hypothetical protein
LHSSCWDHLLPNDIQYTTCDFHLMNVKIIAIHVCIRFDERIFQLIHHLYDIPMEDFLYIDFFCAHYQAKTNSSNNKINNSNDSTPSCESNDDKNSNVTDRSEARWDGSLISFVIILGTTHGCWYLFWIVTWSQSFAIYYNYNNN